MSSIDNHTMLGPVEINRLEMNSVLTDEPASFSTPNAFSYNWFVLPASSMSSNSNSEAAMPAVQTTDGGYMNIESGNRMQSMATGSSMESRVERIVQYILPRD